SLKNSGTRSNLLSGGAPRNCSQNDGAPSGKQAIISRGSCGVQGVPACGPLGIRERRYIDKPTRRARPRSAAILDVAAIVVRLFGGSVCLMEPAWRDLLYNLQTVPIKPKDFERQVDWITARFHLVEVFSKNPALRDRVAKYGGIGRVWMACHQPRTARKEGCTWNREEEQEMWEDLRQALRLPLEVEERDERFGAWLGRQVGLARRVQLCPKLRSRLRKEGGLCNLFKKLQLEALSKKSTCASDFSGTSGIRTPEVWPEHPQATLNLWCWNLRAR
ncbi:unnamed protein product, partial [Effrenium voratum]